ncbi:MAG: KilA-N domain-containing protein [Thiolinea sp.]
MKSNQLMKRELMENIIEQRTSDSFINATSLLSIYNSKAEKPKMLADFWGNKGTDEFLKALCNELNSNVAKKHYLESDLYSTKRGVGGGTYMHPYLFVKFAMWLSAEFEVKVVKWVYDNLIKVRHEAGDHFIEMADAIKIRYIEVNHKDPNPLVYIQEANYLKSLAFGYKDKERNEATEAELKLLDALQLANIKLLQAKIQQKERWVKLRDFTLMYS